MRHYRIQYQIHMSSSQLYPAIDNIEMLLDATGRDVEDAMRNARKDLDRLLGVDVDFEVISFFAKEREM